MDDLLGLWTGPNYLADHGSGLHQLQVDVLSLSLSLPIMLLLHVMHDQSTQPSFFILQTH